MAAPGTPTVTTISDSQLDLAWTNNGSYQVIYIYRSEDGTNYDEIGTGGLLGSTTSYNDTGLTDNKQYWYKICGLVDPEEGCVAGNLSSAGNNWTQPTAPSNLFKKNTQPTQTGLQWTNGNSSCVTYIYKDAVYNKSEEAGDVDTTITGLTADTTYAFKVRHYYSTSGKYSAYTSSINVTTGAAESDSGSETLSFSESTSEVLGSIGTDTLTLTEATSETGTYADTGIDYLGLTDSGAGVATSPLELDFRYYFGGFDGEIFAESNDYKSDNGVDIDVVYETNQVDFANQDTNMLGRWATVYKVKVWYIDISANTTIRCLVSNDGGSTWTQRTKTVGTGDETNKSVDFYFVITGHHFKFKVQNVSSDKDFRLVNMVAYYLPRGEAWTA